MPDTIGRWAPSGERPRFERLRDRARRPIDIVALGSLLTEQVVHIAHHPSAGGQGSIPIRSMTASIGGGAANVAAIGARLGARTMLVSAIGDGPRAHEIRDRLADAGVDVSLLAIRPGCDADLLVLLCDVAGDWVALEQLDPDLRMRQDDLPGREMLTKATWLHVDGYASFTAGDPALVDAAVERARAAGCLVSVDAATPSATAEPGYIRSLFARADVVFANIVEASALTSIAPEDIDGMLTALLDLGPAVVVLKAGGAGSIVASAEGRARIAAIPTVVIDTLAAGDAYVAATLVGLAEGRTLVDAARRGAAAGSVACRTPGSQGGIFDAAAAEAMSAAPGPDDVEDRVIPLGMARSPVRVRPVADLRGLPDGELPRFALVPGSERRVEQIAERLADVRVIAHDREFLAITGDLDGIPMMACSTGIGGHGVSLVVDALGARGADTFIRVGVTGALQDRMRTGDLVVASAAVRLDGTSEYYADLAYPAVADHAVTVALVAAAQSRQAVVHVGIGFTASSFYAGEGIPAFRGFRSASMAGIEAEMREIGVLDQDTETATLFTVARRRGWRAGRVNAVVDDRTAAGYDPTGEPLAIETALEAVRRLTAWDEAGRTWRAGQPGAER